jgi:hypothetical protein
MNCGLCLIAQIGYDGFQEGVSMGASRISGKQGFYEQVDNSQREALLGEYLVYLEQRNGKIKPGSGVLPKREISLEAMNAAARQLVEPLPQAAFDELWAHPDPVRARENPRMLLLLLFSKMNGGEAYGVRVVKAVHGKRWQHAVDLPSRAIQYAQEEEEYHTRILVGAANHYGIQVTRQYVPSAALKVLIGALAYAPKPLFHPVLFGAEVAGVYIFNWTLQQISRWIKDDPRLVEALEQRIIEVLVDEIGHVAFNRLVLGENGRKLGQFLAAQTLRGLPVITPELKPVGFDSSTLRDFDRFDYSALPEEVRRRGFFA